MTQMTLLHSCYLAVSLPVPNRNQRPQVSCLKYQLLSISVGQGAVGDGRQNKLDLIFVDLLHLFK